MTYSGYLYVLPLNCKVKWSLLIVVLHIRTGPLQRGKERRGKRESEEGVCEKYIYREREREIERERERESQCQYIIFSYKELTWQTGQTQNI